MIFLGIILAIFGVAILAVGVLSLAGKLPGNSLVGLRIPEVRKSAEYWVMGHKIAGPAWTGSGLAMLGAAAVAWQAHRQGWEPHYLTPWPFPEDAEHLWGASAPEGAERLYITDSTEPDLVKGMSAAAHEVGIIRMQYREGELGVYRERGD